MNASGIGIVYSLWLRGRWATIGLLTYIAALAMVVQLSSSPLFVASFGVLPPVALVAHLLTVVTLGPADLGARGSSFPRHMLVLPVRTCTLVGWPMLIGTTTIASLWILIAAGVLWPGGLYVPLLWPAAVAAAATAWLQAIGWSPFPSPFARVPALAVALVPLILFGAGAGILFESRIVALLMVVASIVWMFVAYVFATNGLARARAGSEGEWLGEDAGRRLRAIRRRFAAHMTWLPEFRSSFWAHLWLECRRNAIVLPMMFFWMAMPVMLLIVMSVIRPNSRDLYLIASLSLTPSAFGLALLMGFSVMFCGLYGPGLGKFDIWGKDQIPGFFAIRPMSTPRYVQIKMTAAVIGALAVWAMMLLLLFFWALLEASSWNPRPSIVRSSLTTATLRQLAMIAAVPLGLLALSLRAMLSGMWPTLTGRKWLSTALMFAMMTFLTLAGGIGVWAYKHPQVKAELMRWLPWLLAVALAMKLLVTARIVSALRDGGVLSTQAMLRWGAAWVVGCVILFLAGTYFVAPSLTLAAGVLLFMPLTRIAAAPLALYYNRHR